MIIVVSQKKFENSTNAVLDWIEYFGGEFLRINGDDFFDRGKMKMTLDSTGANVFLRNGVEIQPGLFKIGWFRRWSGREFIEPILNSGNSPKNCFEIIKYLSNDESDLRQILFKKLGVKKWLSDPSTLNLSKWDVLEKALGCGLSVPDSLIASKKEDVVDFQLKHGQIIIKDITNPYVLDTNDNGKMVSKTHLLTENEINEMPETFFPVLLQKCIFKTYEIRSFYLDGLFYSMAIFSQSDAKTRVDFRNYNKSKMNRAVPFNLPKSIESKLIKLFSMLNLNTGSADIIKTPEGEYIFLEINPVGQFGMTSQPCNYNLEMKIAEYLVKNDS